MKTSWKKYFLRHSLFTYSRDSLLFFINLFVWTQERSLRDIAVFNIAFLSMHTAMFLIGLPLLKRGRSNLLIKTGIIGLGVVLGLILILGERTIDHIPLIGVLIGIFNGLYWFVNHVESLDIANNVNRASFFSYRMAAQGSAKLAVPAVGWIMFVIFGNGTAGYNAIFAVALLSLIATLILTEVVMQRESNLRLRSSMRELLSTKYLGLLLLNGFVYGASVRSALATVLLPFLIFQVVEKESSLSLVQTAFQILAVTAAYYFGRHKKNISYISRMLVVGSLSTVFGIGLLIMELNIATYIVYTVLYIISLSTMNIGLGTMSNNFASTIKNKKEHRMEFIAIREPAAISGFIAGYVFLYFNTDLGIESLRPMLIFTLVTGIISGCLSVYLWRHVQRSAT